jgi:hypothetical protein
MPTTSGRIGLGIAAASLVLLAGCGSGAAPSASSTGAAAPPSSSVGVATSSAQPATSTAGSPAVVWPAPADPMDRAVQAGLKPQPKEFLTNHVHAHLDVFVDGTPVTVPAGIGINIDDPAVHRFDEPNGTIAYGGIQLCNEPCISPLHTHDVTGILHTESSSPEPNTLGEFFIEWGVALDASCVATYCSPATTIAIYIDGQLTAGDPRAIKLTDHREIAIVIGTPPPAIPSTADFSAA